ncbi:glycosyltransferase [Paucibacter sp. B2R-40]|uniref:glycosyltransferase n=1 Tax=Paucibacter sp. B2R-40 TaxID=2893554 RepID=UPI0021E516FC|nr:glycosyltransferase [Paucibacter sp. B2R-40]MCV2355933.1 glycosyltransferase [Paucibacter sp. B2R-40]
MSSTPDIHLCIQQPANYVHSLGLLDQARYFRYQFRRLGANVSMSKNRLRYDAINFVFGAHLGFEASQVQSHACVFVNLEQLGEGGAPVTPEYLQLLSSSSVVDYHAGNRSAYSARPNEVPVLPLWFAPYLKPAQSTPLEERPIDLLFFGSINERRRGWLERIEALGLSVAVFDGPLYGPERDEFIKQAKAVINMHFYASSRFEQARVAHCMSLGTPVISERAAHTDILPPFDETVFWLQDEQLETFFQQQFGTAAFFERARLSLQRFEASDPAKAYADVLIAACKMAQAHHQGRTPGAWSPTCINLEAGAAYRAGWLNLDAQAASEPDWMLDLSVPLNFPLSSKTLHQGQVELAEAGADVIQAGRLDLDERKLPALLSNALRLLHVGGEFQLELPGAFGVEPVSSSFALLTQHECIGRACSDFFWSLGWFEHRFELLGNEPLDLDGRHCKSEQARFSRLLMRKVETSLRERTTARTKQTDLRLPSDDVDVAHRLVKPAQGQASGASEARQFKWSILVPTLPARRELRKRLLAILEPQVARFPDVELLVLEDNRSRQYGPKLQAMIDIAQGEYVNFVDDDDVISEHYVETIYPLLTGVDCVGFSAQVSVEGGPFKSVFYSIKNKIWVDAPEGYYRNPQHLTPIRRELVLQVPWVGHYGADRTWSHKMASKGLLKTENVTDEILYTYYATQKENREGVWR